MSSNSSILSKRFKALKQGKIFYAESLKEDLEVLHRISLENMSKSLFRVTNYREVAELLSDSSYLEPRSSNTIKIGGSSTDKS